MACMYDCIFAVFCPCVGIMRMSSAYVVIFTRACGVGMSDGYNKLSSVGDIGRLLVIHHF